MSQQPTRPFDGAPGTERCLLENADASTEADGGPIWQEHVDGATKAGGRDRQGVLRETVGGHVSASGEARGLGNDGKGIEHRGIDWLCTDDHTAQTGEVESVQTFGRHSAPQMGER